MKSFALLMVCAFILLVSGQSAAAESLDETDLMLERMAGTWYDEAGNAVLTIKGRAINGCEVVAMESMVGGRSSGGAKFISWRRAGCARLASAGSFSAVRGTISRWKAAMRCSVRCSPTILNPSADFISVCACIPK